MGLDGFSGSGQFSVALSGILWALMCLDLSRWARTDCGRSSGFSVGVGGF